MGRTDQKVAYIRTEGTSYGTDPDNDGSDYVFMPTYSIGEIPNGMTLLETNYMTGRGHPTAPVSGPDGGAIEIVAPVIGLPTEAGDGISASVGADDWYDDCWENHVTESPTEREGEAVLSATTADITFDAAATNLATRDLIAVYDAANANLSRRSQIVQLNTGSGAGPWTVDPDFEFAPTSTAVAYAGRSYLWTPAGRGGNSRSIVIRDSDVGNTADVGTYLGTGGRITSRSIVAEAGQRWEDRMTWNFDAIVEDSSDKTSLPDPGIAPAVPPLICTLSPVWFGGTNYATRRVEINFNIEAQPITATSGAHGRSGWDILACKPTVTIEPLATDAIRVLKRAVTQGSLLVQMGAGVFGTVVNTCAFFAQAAYVSDAERTDENDRARQTVTFTVIEPGIFSGSTFGNFWHFVRF